MQKFGLNLSAGTVALAALLAFGGCDGGSDPINNPPKPGGNKDASVTGNDGSTTGVDTGVGTADSGTQTGGPCPPNTTGCRCTPPAGDAGAGQGSCIDPADSCAQLGDTLAVCARECMADTDCNGAMIAGQRAAAMCRGGICVEAEKQDDEGCRLHGLGGRQVTGCREGANCISIGENVPPGEGTCLQFCTPTPMDPTGGCPNDLPFCNPNVLSNGGMAIGVCSETVLNAGARCRGGNTFTQRCNSDMAAGRLFCLSNDLVDIWRSLPADEGFCMEDCNPDMPSCPGTSDPTLGPGQCVNLGTGADGTKVGLCSNGCEELPEDCTGPGSLGAGTRCIGIGLRVGTSTDAGGDIGLCTDVQTPTIAEARVANNGGRPSAIPGMVPTDCMGAGRDGTAYQCTAGTTCFETLGSMSSPVAGCVRLCTRTATVAPYDKNQCANGLADSVCVPLATTSTVIDVGFCSVQP